jgi:hypothetical protein
VEQSKLGRGRRRNVSIVLVFSGNFRGRCLSYVPWASRHMLPSSSGHLQSRGEVSFVTLWFVLVVPSRTQSFFNRVCVALSLSWVWSVPPSLTYLLRKILSTKNPVTQWRPCCGCNVAFVVWLSVLVVIVFEASLVFTRSEIHRVLHRSIPIVQDVLNSRFQYVIELRWFKKSVNKNCSKKW